MPQYKEIQSGKGDAFSPLICLVLLLANSLRIFYRLGEVFDDVLVYQVCLYACFFRDC